MKVKNLLWVFVISTLTGGCHFYKIGQAKNIDYGVVSKQVQAGDYLIVHEDGNLEYYHFKVERYSEEELEGKIWPVSMEHDLYNINRNNPQKSVWRYKRSENYPINETHLFVTSFIKEEEKKVTIPIENIHRVDIYDEAKGLTIASYVGIPAVAISGGFLIFLLIACSCPQVYIAENDQFIHQGGLYAGAMSPKMERYDHRLLPDDFGNEQSYVVKIRNENPEIDYLDFLELQKVFHKPDEFAMQNREGEIMIGKSNRRPENLLHNGKTVHYSQPFLLEMTGTNDKNGLNEIVFDVGSMANESNLLLTIEAKNTGWMDYTFRKFFSLFGSEYSSFKERQSNQPVEERINWLISQGVFLNVYLDNGNGWEFHDYFTIAGSETFRTLAIELEKDLLKPETKIKLESGFNFWEINDIQIADLVETTPESKSLQPTKILDKNGDIIEPDLNHQDLSYELVLPSGDEATFYFEKSGLNDNGTLFLNARGYYEYDFHFTGKAQKTQLKKFRKAGYLSRFSMENYTLHASTVNPTTSYDYQSR